MRKGVMTSLALVAGTAMMMFVATPTWAAKVGDPLPEFSIPMLSGKTLVSSDMLKEGKTVVITFIQTACSSCKGEIVELQRLAKNTKSGTMVLPIAVDMRSGKDFLESYKSENGVGFDFGLDPKFTIPGKFDVSSTPASIVVKGGKVVEILRGYNETIKSTLAKYF